MKAFVPYEELTKQNTDPEIVENLINAIVLQAVKDIKSNMPQSKCAQPWQKTSAQRNRKDAIMFFKSSYFTFLTGMDGNWLLEQIAKEYDLDIN